jgi:type IV pilus assembly protein PilA
MKNFLKSLRRQDGFTLVELMVVVAIIGLLSAVAIPNFKKYQAKAKTSEAKLQLSAVYTAMQSWYSDFDNYGGCLNLMGYDPAVERPSRYYAVGFPTTGTPVGNALSVTNGAPTACTGAGSANDTSTVAASSSNTTAWGAGKVTAGVAVIAGAGLTSGVPGIAIPTSTTFVAGALGVIDASKTGAADADAWSVNADKRLNSVRTGY